MDNPEITAYASCECGSEVLRVEYDHEWREFNVSIYLFPEKTSWTQRFRYIWKIIRDGNPFGDQIIPRYEEMRNVQKLLNEVFGK